MKRTLQAQRSALRTVAQETVDKLVTEHAEAVEESKPSFTKVGRPAPSAPRLNSRAAPRGPDRTTLMEPRAPPVSRPGVRAGQRPIQLVQAAALQAQADGRCAEAGGAAQRHTQRRAHAPRRRGREDARPADARGSRGASQAGAEQEGCTTHARARARAHNH
jgi:hypothetical protein